MGVVLVALAVAQQLGPGLSSLGEGTPVLTLLPAADTLEMNDSLRLVAMGGGEPAEGAEEAVPTWSSSDTLVATVDPDGLVVAHAAGQVTIRALLGGIEGAARLVVLDSAAVAVAALDTAAVEETAPQPRVSEETAANPLPEAPDLGVETIPRERPRTLVGTVTLDVGNTTMRVGSGGLATARVLNLTGRRIPPGDYTVTWHSNDEDVLDVQRGGTFSAVGPGYAYVVATVIAARDTVLDSLRVTVPAEVAEVRVEGGDITVQVGSSTQLSATVLDPQGRLISSRNLRWRSSDAGVASVGASTGQLVAHQVGVVTVTAGLGSVEGSVAVTVEEPPPPPPVATVEEARAELERYAALLSEGNTEAVAALFGGAAGEERHRTLLDRMDEPDFSASLGEVSEPAQAESGSTVSFQVELSWRGFSGARQDNTVTFRASLEPTPEGWRIASCVLAPDAEP